MRSHRRTWQCPSCTEVNRIMNKSAVAALIYEGGSKHVDTCSNTSHWNNRPTGFNKRWNRPLLVQSCRSGDFGKWIPVIANVPILGTLNNWRSMTRLKILILKYYILILFRDYFGTLIKHINEYGRINEEFITIINYISNNTKFLIFESIFFQ